MYSTISVPIFIHDSRFLKVYQILGFNRQREVFLLYDYRQEKELYYRSPIDCTMLSTSPDTINDNLNGRAILNLLNRNIPSLINIPEALEKTFFDVDDLYYRLFKLLREIHAGTREVNIVYNSEIDEFVVSNQEIEKIFEELIFEEQRIPNIHMINFFRKKGMFIYPFKEDAGRWLLAGYLSPKGFILF